MTAPVGKILRKIRIDHDERLSDMARHLAVSSAFLSSVELGKKPPPPRLLESVIAQYRLAADAATQLLAASYAGRDRFELVATSRAAREVAGALERLLPTLPDSALQEIAEALQRIQQAQAARE
jgi:hypothetical protein